MKTTNILIILFLFFLGSIIGWLLEFFFNRFNKKSNPEGRFINPGFLSGPYLPIYGFGVVTLYTIGYLLKGIAFSNPFLEAGVLFIVSSLLMTLLELLGGLFFIHVMHIKLWDYSDVPFNYKGIICLKFSILWGVGSLFYLYFINPFILNAVAAFVDHIEFSFIIGMFYGFLLIDLYKTMDIAAALRKLAKENDAKVIAYRNLKDSFIKEVKQYKRRTDIFKYPDPKTLRKLFDDLEMAGNNQRK